MNRPNFSGFAKPGIGERIVAIVLPVIGVVCTAIGVFFAFQIADHLRENASLRDALIVDATVLSVDTKTSGGGRSGSSTRTVATYIYQHEGVEYRSSSLALWRDSLPLYDPLRSAMEADQPVPCFIDPHDPALSYLDIEFSIWPVIAASIFVLAFGGVGIVCLFVTGQAVLYALRSPD